MKRKRRQSEDVLFEPHDPTTSGQLYIVLVDHSGSMREPATDENGPNHESNGVGKEGAGCCLKGLIKSDTKDPVTGKPVKGSAVALFRSGVRRVQWSAGTGRSGWRVWAVRTGPRYALFSNRRSISNRSVEWAKRWGGRTCTTSLTSQLNVDRTLEGEKRAESLFGIFGKKPARYADHYC